MSELAGVTPGWVYIGTGGPGTATAIPAAMLVDDEGGSTVEFTGEARVVTVYDDASH